MGQYVTQTSFAKGAIDATLQDRQDADFYGFALGRAENVFPDLAGTLYSRPSLQSAFTLAYPTTLPTFAGTTQFAFSQRVTRSAVYQGSTAVFIVDLLVPVVAGSNVPVLYINVINAVAPFQNLSPAQIIVPVTPDFDPTKLLSPQISTAQGGPSFFFASQGFPPFRYYYNAATGLWTYASIQFYAELYGDGIRPDGKGTTSTTHWKSSNGISKTQLNVGSIILFKDKEYTVTQIDDDENFLTTPYADDVRNVQDIGAVRVANAFGVNAAGQLVYPGLVAFFASRLIYFRTTAKPTAMFASRANQPYTIVAANTNDSDPINYEFLADGLDSIVWATSNNQLFFGSGQGEYSGSSSYATFGPSSARAYKSGATGSNGVPIMEDGSLIYFTNRSGTQLLSLQYDFYHSTFNNVDVSALVPSYLTGGITEMAYRPETGSDRTPRALILTGDGRLAAVALESTQNIVAWSQFIVPQGTTPVSVGSSRQALFVSVSFISSGVTYVQLGVVSGIASDTYSLDLNVNYGVVASPALLLLPQQRAAVTVAAVSSTKGFLGYFGPDNNGSITLPGSGATYGNITVGVPFTARADLLPAKIADPTGSRLNRKRRVNRVMVDVSSTVQLMVNGVPLLSQLSTPTGTGTVPQTGVFEARVLGWINQDMTVLTTPPGFPLTLKSVTREVG